jgi:ADP-ribose pyrophosphatase YjhB (NUDIX family)
MEKRHHSTAGGVVFNDAGQVLVLERDVPRDGKIVHEIRLPKGHIDEGESPEDAAMREVGEESGYWAVAIVADLGTAHSTFSFRGQDHERHEQYYLMSLTSPERQGPRFDEGSAEALFSPTWLAPSEAERQLTYSSEEEFVRRARQWQREQAGAGK